MRSEKTFEMETANLGKKKITVYEVSPFTILQRIKNFQKEEFNLNEYWDLLELCTDIKKEDLLALYPSEQKIILVNFKEVNSDFFLMWPPIKRAIEKLGLVDWLIDLVQRSEVLKPVKEIMIQTFQKRYKEELSSL